MFLAVCAYIGAALFAPVGFDVPRAESASVGSGTEIKGIAVRTEQLVCSVSGISGCRISAGDGHSAGVWFDSCDGYEFLSPDMLFPFTENTPERLMAFERAETESGRIVTEHIWYFAAYAEQELEKGACRVFFDGLDGAVEAEITETDGAAVLLRLRCGGEALSLRVCSARVIPAGQDMIWS